MRADPMKLRACTLRPSRLSAMGRGQEAMGGPAGPSGYEVPPYDQWDWTDEPLGYEVPAADDWGWDA